MAHVSGNPAWQDWPSTATLVTAESLENIENAVDQLDPSQAGPWMSLTLQNGWLSRDVAMSTANFYAPACRRLPNGLAEIAGTLYRATGATNGLTVATLPDGHRPARETCLVGTDSAGYPISIIVQPNGALNVSTFRTTATTLTLLGQFSLSGPT